MISKNIKKITALWIVVVLVLFIASITLGILMRLNQSEVLKLSPLTFYKDMTVHGLTMIGIWYVAGMAAVNYIMERYVKTSYLANAFAMVMTIIGVVMLWLSVFVGDYHAGWTFLYPLTFYASAETWVIILFLGALTVLGIGWLVWSLSLVASLFKKYSLSEIFAWQYFKKNPKTETPPFVLISMISLTGIIVCLFSAVVLLVLLYAEYFSKGTFVNDSLLIKNLTYFFGHTIANEMLYLGLAIIYELFGEISGRAKWKTTWYVSIAWNLTLIFVLTAFFHHLYMDFAQPEGLQLVGQIASYLASVPSAGVTVFSLIVAVSKVKINWNLSNLLFFIGVAGWVVGGVGALLDATISNNFVLHNTLWVPAHFHTYNAMGNVLFSLGFFYWFTNQDEQSGFKESLSNLKLLTIVIGGAGFLMAFYVAGADSIPRRYSNYPVEFTNAKTLALAGAIFATIYLIGILSLFFRISKKCIKVLYS